MIDEGRMAHSGQIWAIIAKMKPRRVEILGDPQQVPYVNFSTLPMFCGQFTGFDSVETKNETYRLSVKAAAAVLHMYSGKLRVKGTKDGGVPFRGDLNVVKISSIAEVPKRQGVLYACFYQWEKQQLLKSGFCAGHVKLISAKEKHRCGVSTVVEVQGADYAEICIVRLENRPKRGTIYSEERRVNSILTRSWNKVTYYTACDVDMLSVWIRFGSTIENISRVSGEYDVVNSDGSIEYNALKPYVPINFGKVVGNAGVISIDY
jgi:hypothetical protein